MAPAASFDLRKMVAELRVAVASKLARKVAGAPAVYDLFRSHSKLKASQKLIEHF
jgi:hypothetical protein